jgi:endonuclease/exonuclease/phosphatase family metal-dependent hydrolase
LQEDTVHRYFNPNVQNATLSFVLAVLLAVCLSASANASSRGESGATEPNLSVMTFNIRYGTAKDGDNAWPNRKEMVCDVLRKYDPDIVGLQEALRFQIDDIRAALPHYEEIGVGRDGKTAGEYSAILYRKGRLDVNDSGTFWLSDTPDVCASITWGNACTRVCTWGRFTCNGSGKSFYLFNTHLDHISQYSRDRSAVLLAERVQNRRHKDPVIVTGDLNAGEDNSVVRYLKGERELPVAKNGLAKNPVPLVDTFRILKPDASKVGTFNGFKGNDSGAKIDYIFAQPGTTVFKAEILRDNKDNRYPSDHFPLLSVLGL